MGVPTPIESPGDMIEPPLTERIVLIGEPGCATLPVESGATIVGMLPVSETSGTREFADSFA